MQEQDIVGAPIARFEEVGGESVRHHGPAMNFRHIPHPSSPLSHGLRRDPLLAAFLVPEPGWVTKVRCAFTDLPVLSTIGVIRAIGRPTECRYCPPQIPTLCRKEGEG